MGFLSQNLAAIADQLWVEHSILSSVVVAPTPEKVANYFPGRSLPTPLQSKDVIKPFWD
jgi:hypothetical protein